jgi:hypothetical protein
VRRRILERRHDQPANALGGPLGWRSPTELLVGVQDGDSYRIVGLSVDGSAAT